MMVSGWSSHALRRSSQRNISRTDLEFVLRFGRMIHNGGAIFVFLCGKDIPDEYQANDDFSRLEGSVLVLSREDGGLITTYRNRHGLRDIRKKLKWHLPTRRAA